MLSLVEHAFVGWDEIRAPLKTPAYEATYLQVPLVYSSPSTSVKLNFINLHLSSQFILVNKGVNEETARRSLAAFQCHCRCCKEVTAAM